MKKWLIAIIVILIVALWVAVDYAKGIEGKWKNEAANVKAYSELLSESESTSTALQLTVSQLEHYSDSVLQELNTVREDLKVKDKRLKALQKISSVYAKNDTIVVKDTIFKEPAFALDTVIGDNWYKVAVGLKYPSQVSVSPEFRSEKYIVVSSKKETVNPPKKFFLLRWFQKKHLILNVDVVERNPYIIQEQSRFVEIIR